MTAPKPIAFALVALLCGCASAAGKHRNKAATLAKGHKPGAAIDELRKAIALDGRDRKSHAQLGRLEFARGRPGAAITHLERAYDLGLREDSKLLAKLLLQRAGQRQKLGYSERWRDLVRARELDRKLATQIAQPLAEALREAGLRRWLAGDREGADKLWRRVPTGVPAGTPVGKRAFVDGLRRVLAEPKKAALADLKRTVMLVRETVGESAARSLLNVYRSRKGAALAPAPCPDPAVVEVGHGGCASLLHALADASLTSPQSVRLELRAKEAVPPAVLADVVVLSLSQWLWGRRDDWFDAELRAFVLRETQGPAFQATPAWLQPTVRRLRGLSSGAPGVPNVASARERLVVAMEFALRGRTQQAQSLLTEVKLPLAKVAKATVARAAAAAAPDDLTAWTSERLRVSLARFAYIANQFSRSTATQSNEMIGPLPRKMVTSRSGCAKASRKQWFAAQSTYFADVKLGTQAVEDVVAEEPSRFCRGVDAVDFFVRQGDFARAQRMARALRLEDANAQSGLLVALRAFAAGDNVPRAQQILQDAEYWSGRRGSPSLFAAKTFLDAGKPVPALAAARAALALGDGAVRWDAFELIVVAALQLDRKRDAERAFHSYLADLPARLRSDVARRVAKRLARYRLSRPSWVEPIEPGPGVMSAERSAALSPWAARPRIELIAHADNKERLALELLLIGLSVEGERAAQALEAFAEVAEAKGKHALASSARQEAALLR